jgi:hypothetical protein
MEGKAIVEKEKVDLFLFDEYVIIQQNQKKTQKLKLKETCIYSENLGFDDSSLILKSKNQFIELKFQSPKISEEWKKKVMELLIQEKLKDE